MDAIRNPIGDTAGADVFETNRSQQQRRADPNPERYRIQIQSTEDARQTDPLSFLGQLLGPIGAIGIVLVGLLIALATLLGGED